MKATLRSYVIGFVLSLVFTLTAAGLAWVHISSGHTIFEHPFLDTSFLVLAFVQAIVQLIFFMHLGAESGPRWRLWAFVSTAGIILIIVLGAIWIMNHLNYNMMASPQQMNEYIQSQDGL